MTYILRTRANHTLGWNGREYTDGDTIAISKADAELSTASIDAMTAPPAPAPSGPTAKS